MLHKLAIQNYAIIDALEISFANNLSIITGETGAGKSILMGALSLILGDRADTSILMNREKKCIVEGYFKVDQEKAVRDFIHDNDLDNEDELVIRREITANGKSRAFINDTPATLLQLRQLASLLVDLHQQFDTLELGDADFQREVLDALANNQELVLQYQKQYRAWQQALGEWKKLAAQKENAQKEFDYHQFIFNELEQLNLEQNELEDLEQELKLLSNAEGIKTTLAKVLYEIAESESPLASQLKQLAGQLVAYADFHAQLPAITERLYSTQLELQDIASELENINDHIQFDQERIDFINDRLSAGYKVLKKHGVQTTNQLLDIKNDLQQKLEAVVNIDESLENKLKESEALEKTCRELAGKIAAKRKGCIGGLEKNVNHLLKQVGMPNARLKVHLEEVALNAYGKDDINFLFDANNSNRFERLHKVASGGELSRLMLCIKSLVAQSIDLPTLIFDEIDTGISGEAARQVGIILKELATSRQVICITHQPQIAGKATSHYFVYKETRGNTTTTGIKLLSQEERITAIAKMLSGEQPTAAALQNAKEMVMN